MKTASELEAAFAVYVDEIQRCEAASCYWALLHLAVALPDICAALEWGNSRPVGQRYVQWCTENFAVDQRLTPADRYQIRNRLLHEGTTLTSVPESQYGSISFVAPDATTANVHLLVTPDGANVAINVKAFADETLAAVRRWFSALESDPVRNAAVEANLPRLARRQPKISEVFDPSASGRVITMHFSYQTTSSKFVWSFRATATRRRWYDWTGPAAPLADTLVRPVFTHIAMSAKPMLSVHLYWSGHGKRVLIA